MTFEERLVFWKLQGKVKSSNPGNQHKSMSKVGIKLTSKYSLYVRYNKHGPLSASIYYDDGIQFNLEDRIGVAKTVNMEMVDDTIQMWLKDIA